MTQGTNKSWHECCVMFFTAFHGWAVILVISTWSFIDLHVCNSAEYVRTCVSEAHRGHHKPECPTLGVEHSPVLGFHLSISRMNATQIGLDNNSHGQSAKNRCRELHLQPLLLKDSFYHSLCIVTATGYGDVCPEYKIFMSLTLFFL